jgi:hypothetical protein
VGSETSRGYDHERGEVLFDHQAVAECSGLAYILPRFNNLLARATSSGSTRIFAVWNVDE